MKLTCKNFRWYKDEIIELPLTGSVLLSGGSGKGKTTVLNALYYVFYGKLKKPYSHGKNKCTVQLEIESIRLSITRSNRPNTLVVIHGDSIYQDDAAQGYLDSEITGLNHDEFCVSSYVVQRKDNSILSMTPKNQLEFLQVLSFLGKEALNVKNNITQYARECQEKLVKLKGQQELLEKQLNDLSENLPNEPESSRDPKDIKRDISKLKKKISAKSSELSKAIDTSQKHSEYIAKTQRINDLEVELESLGETENEDELREQLSRCKSFEEHTSTIKQYKREKKRYLLERNNTTAIYEKELGVYVDLQILNDAISKQKELMNSQSTPQLSSGQIKEINDKLESRRSLLESKKKTLGDGVPMACPSCKTYLVQGPKYTLSLSSNKKPSKKTITGLKRAQTSVNNIEKSISKYEERLGQTRASDDVFDSDLYSELIHLKEIHEQYTNHLNSKIPPSLSTLRKTIRNSKKSFPEEIPPGDIDKIRSDLEELRSRNEQRSRVLKLIKKYRSEVEDTDKPRHLTTNEKDIKKLDKEKSLLQERYGKLVQDLEASSTAQVYKENIKHIDSIETSLADICEAIMDATDKYEGATGLLKAAKEAEVLAMKHTLDSINEHARHHLEQMFNDPISVTLETSRKLVSSKDIRKIEISTRILYHGNLYSSIEEFSGGERQRCELAFLLGVSDMLGSKFLFLDECLNNLDAFVNMDVLTKLKEYANDKLVLIVSHEAIKGIFDLVIEF